MIMNNSAFRRGQTTLEYFIVFAVVAIVTIVLFRSIRPQTVEPMEGWFKSAAKEIAE